MSLKTIMKNIGNIFKTSEELEQEKRQRKRHFERSIEKSIEALTEGQKQAQREQEKFYQDAKQKLAVGRESEAKQLIQFSRMQARNADNFTRQKLIWANALTQVRVATSMQSAAVCFKQLAAECGLNPDVFESGLDSMDDVESTIGAMNKAMTEKWEKDSRKAGEMNDVEGDPTIDEMMDRARSEVAAENGVPGAGSATPASGSL